MMGASGGSSDGMARLPRWRLWWEAYLIARKIESTDEGVRARALDRLRQAGDRSPDLIKTLLSFDRAGKTVARVMAVYMVVSCLVELLRHYRLGVPLRSDQFITDLAFVVAVPLVVFFSGSAITKTHRRILETLSVDEDPRVIDAILEVASMDRFGTAGLDLARSALDRLRSTYSSGLPSLQTKLYKLIESNNPALAEAAIAAAARIGDTGAIPHVRAVAEGRRSGRKFESVRREARGCLEKLEAIAEREKVSGRLLRAADASVGDSGVLLRAAGAGEVDDAILLRPSETEVS